jgi:hypothetical protein
MPAALVERLALEFLFIRVGPLGRMVLARHGADIGLDRAVERPQQYRHQHQHIEKLRLDLARRLRLDRPCHVGRAFRRLIASTPRMLNAGLAAGRDFRPAF